MSKPEKPDPASINRRQALAALGLSALPFPLEEAGSANDSPFLHGIYAPVKEEKNLQNLKVEGTIPPHLEGTYLRNGPNPRQKPKGRYHWFDGDGMIHSVALRPSDRSNPAVYSNRWVRTAGFKEEEKAGKSLYPGLLEMPDLAKMARGEDGYKNAANTALCWHQGHLLALWEGGLPHKIDPKSLATLGPIDFKGAWKGSFTAHPKIDPTNGEMVFFGYGPVKPYLRLGIVNANGVLIRQKPVDLPRAIMIHDFAITKDFAIFLDMPQTFAFSNLIAGKGVIGWEPGFGARLGVVPRGQGGLVRWFEVDPGSVFHTLGAWQEGQKVELIVCRMQSYPADILAGKTDQVPLLERPRLYRYVVNLETGRLNEGPIDDPGVDMPRMDDRLTGRKIRFGYTMETDFQGLRKHDLEKGSTVRFGMPNGFFCGEPVFVGRPGAQSEDDGHLLFAVQPGGENPGQLWVVAAADFQTGPIAKIHLQTRVPMGFHGVWLPTA